MERFALIGGVRVLDIGGDFSLIRNDLAHVVRNGNVMSL